MKTNRLLPLLALLALPWGPPLLAADTELVGGDWVEKGYSIKGGWQIVERDGERVIVFDDGFRTRKGPDLKVYLSTLPVGKLKDRNVESSSIEIAPLKSNRGAQEYALPADIDLDEFSSLVVHCEAYSHLWGGAALKE